MSGCCGCEFVPTGGGSGGGGTGGSTDASYLPEIWAQNDVAANQAAVALEAQLSTISDAFRANRAGSLIGIVAQLSEAITAGTLTIEVYINGVASGFTLALNAGMGGQTAQAPGIDGYAAGDLITVRITTTVGFLPVSTDLEVKIQVSEPI